MSLHYTTKHFSTLTTLELYHILALRIEVFCVEQNCVYQDCDNRDFDAYHILGTDQEGNLHAYCRLLDQGVSYPSYASIGRVITSAAYRGKGEGKKLMQYAIEQIQEKYVGKKIKISAQSYAIPFYQSLGFESVGEEYLEDDIPHVGMVLQSQF